MALKVAEHHGLASRQGRAEVAVKQALIGPGQFTSSGLPGAEPVGAIGAEDEIGITAHGLLATDDTTPAQVGAVDASDIDTTHRGLEGACTERVAHPQQRAHQVVQALDLVGAARRGDGHLPAHAAVGRVETQQLGADAGHQRVLVSRQHARLGQRQGLAGALLGPEAAAVDRVEGMHHPINAEHEHPLAGDQRRGGGARGQARCPFLDALLQHHELVVDRHHRG